MKDAKKPSQAEMEEAKKALAQRRMYALKNLKSSGLVDLGTAYIVENSGKFGDVPGEAFEKFKYMPALTNATLHNLETGEEENILRKSLLDSREGGKRYSGNVTETKIIKDSAAILQEALLYITVEDLMGILGVKGSLKTDLKNVTIGTLGDEEKNLMIASYQGYNSKLGVSQALAESAKELTKGLESVLTEPVKKA